MLQAFVLAALAGLVSVPWWLTVYLQHGAAPFISAMSSGVHDLSPLKLFVSDLFARDTFIPILMILRVAGIIWEAAHRRFTLLLWAALAYFLDERSAGTTSFLAFSLLCAIGFADALPFLVNWLKTRKSAAIDFIQLRWLNATLIAVMFYLFLECGVYSYVLVNTSLHTPEPFQALQWVSENTSPNSRFLLLTGSSGIMSDPIQEWFPALAGRESQTTMQGLEWTLNKDFFPRLRESHYLAGLHDFGLCESVVSKYKLGLRLYLDLKVEYHAALIEFGQAGYELCSGLREFVNNYLREKIVLSRIHD